MGLDLTDKQFSKIPHFSNICQFEDKLTHVKHWTGAEYKDMLTVWVAVHHPLLKQYPDHCMFTISVTNFILNARYHPHIKTTLKYLLDVLSGISSHIHRILPYRRSHSLSKIFKIDCLLHYIEYTWKISSANYSNTEMSKTAHRNLIKDSYHSFNNVNYIPQMLQWKMCLFDVKLKVSILLQIIDSDRLFLKADICRKLLVGDSLTSDKLSPSLIPCINRVMSKHNMIATLTFPEGVSILEYIDTLTSYCSTFQVDTSTSLDLWTSPSHALGILSQKIYQAYGITVSIQQYNNWDAVVVHNVRYMEKWHRQDNQFNNIFIQGYLSPWNSN